MAAHLAHHCLETEIACPAGCGARMLRKLVGKGYVHLGNAPSNLTLHYAECPKILLHCPYLHAGCFSFVARDQMAAHHTECADGHAKLVSNQFQTLRKRCETLEEGQNWVGCGVPGRGPELGRLWCTEVSRARIKPRAPFHY